VIRSSDEKHYDEDTFMLGYEMFNARLANEGLE